MHDCTEFAGGEELAHRPELDDVELVKEEPGTRTQALEARLLEPDVVVVVQIVDADDFVTAIEQLVRQRRTDEPGSSRDKNLHFLFSLPSCRSGQPPLVLFAHDARTPDCVPPSSRYPHGFMLCHRHASRHISSSEWAAFHPSLFSASVGSA